MNVRATIALLRSAGMPAAALLALAAVGAAAQTDRRPAVYDVSAAGLQRYQDAEVRRMTPATVTRHVDGDTFEVSVGDPPYGMRAVEKIRLLGIDTPELGEPLAAEAQALTARLAAGPVYLAFDFRRRDRFERLLAFVYLRDGTLLNAELLRSGLATVYRADDLMHFFAQFEDLEREARQRGAGLWEGRTGSGVVVVIIRNAGRAEHVELRNDGPASIDLSGWRVRDDDGDAVEIPPGTVLAPGKTLALGSGSGCVDTPHPCVRASTRNIWSNSGDAAELLDRGGTVVHAYSY